MLRLTVCLFLVATSVVAAASIIQTPPREAITGRWDLTIRDGQNEYPSWLEINEKADTLTGRFVSRRGEAGPLSTVRIDGDRIGFVFNNEDEKQSGLHFTGRVQGDRMSGTLSEAGKKFHWSAVRAPSLVRSTLPRWGKPIALLNGKDLRGWKSFPAGKPSRWEARENVLFNAGSGAGLVTLQTFDDFRLHLEFKIEPGSDSGVYLRGRYEIEIEDSFGKSPSTHLLGSIYGFLSPTSLPAKRAGEWQTIDATLVGRTITVVLNGETIISEQEIPGITGGALDSDEKSPGPIMLQGDYGQVSYRNIIITPALGKR
ncbi:MAG: DUF1080 domain-containing protein [Pyrinomonadaceae bacterium]